MKPSQIRVGATYQNRGAGSTRRKVLGIGLEHRPTRWYSCGPRPDEPGVSYVQEGKIEGEQRLYLSSFAAWCGKEVTT